MRKKKWEKQKRAIMESVKKFFFHNIWLHNSTYKGAIQNFSQGKMSYSLSKYQNWSNKNMSISKLCASALVSVKRPTLKRQGKTVNFVFTEVIQLQPHISSKTWSMFFLSGRVEADNNILWNKPLLSVIYVSLYPSASFIYSLKNIRDIITQIF